MKYQEELKLLNKIVRPIYEEAIKTSASIFSKGDQDIVTSTDLYIEKHLIEGILKAFPNDFMHSEEYHNDTKLKNRTWIIDPIDGTSNYAANLDLYVVQIALYDKDDIALSFVYMPRSHKTYVAVNGEGAFINGERYYINGNEPSSNMMISMVGLSHKAEDKDYYKKIIDLAITKKYKVRILGSIGLELCFTSEGNFNIFYSDVTNLWDLYPGLLLVREAGAILLNEKGEDYSLGDLNLFVCKNEEAKAVVLKDIL